MEIHNAGKFHRYSMFGCQDMYFQRFLKEQKVQFLAASRWFLGHNSLKWRPICTKFLPLINCKVMHHIYYAFWTSLKLCKSQVKKLIFWFIFSGFLITPSYALNVTPQFLENWNFWWRSTILASFIFIAFVVWLVSIWFEVTKVEVDLNHQMVHFWWFFGHNSPKYGPILLKFPPELKFKESK